MVLLVGQSLTPAARFDPESFQLTLGERDSSATITVGPEVPEIGIGSWLQDDTDPGRGIVWRVKSISTDYSTETRTISLEHIVQILKDFVISGTIGSSESSMSALQAAQAVMGVQGIWTLGAFEYDLRAPYEFNGDSVYDALESISGTLADSRWEYDLSALPFRLHILQPASDIRSEMRAGRNMSTITRSVDRSRMYTRIYPVGANDMRLSGGGYIEQNTEIYGLVCKVETNQGCASEGQLRMWAEDRLRRHCEPAVSITVKGLDLSRETGEPLDQLTVGRLCRVPMPELGTVITEKITRVQWRDKVQDPEDVTVTLANNRPDVATLFRSERATTEKSTRTGARVGGKNQKKNEEDIGKCYIHITEASDLWSVKLGNTEKELSAKISVQADRIGLIVQGEGKNAKIRPAQIVSSINESGSDILISASKVQLEGNVSLNSIFSVNGSAIVAKKPIWLGAAGRGPVISSSGINTPLLGLMSGGQGVTLKASDVEKMVISAATSADGKTLILKTKDYKTINFSKATTLEGKWSGRVFTVTATPQDETITTTIGSSIARGDIAWNSDGYTGYATLYATISGQSGRVTVGSVSIDAYAAYQAGGGGASHTTRYELYCDSVNPLGGGEADYVFKATLKNAPFVAKRSYDFWR